MLAPGASRGSRRRLGLCHHGGPRLVIGQMLGGSCQGGLLGGYWGSCCVGETAACVVTGQLQGSCSIVAGQLQGIRRPGSTTACYRLGNGLDTGYMRPHVCAVSCVWVGSLEGKVGRGADIGALWYTCAIVVASTAPNCPMPADEAGCTYSICVM